MDRDLARDVAKQIDTRLRALREELVRKNRADADQLKATHRATADELARTTRALGKVTKSVADLERRLARAEQRLDDEAQARHDAEQAHLQELGDLHSRHAALSRRQALESGSSVAALDARDDELAALAATARHGADLLARRLSDGERAHLATLADAWSAWERGRLARRMRAVMLSRKLADGPIDDPGRPVDADAFRAVVQELVGLDERREATRAAAEDAARRLAEDEALRRDSGAAVVAGEAADRRIRAVAGERVGAAVTRGDLMPAWFESVLRAPPSGGDPRWMQVASALVAYRILYGVDDPASAFGPEPADDWPRARREARLGLQQAVLAPPLRPAGTLPPAR